MAPSLVFLIGAACLCVLSFLTWQRALLWQDTDRLELYWAYANPDSPRAHNSIAAYFARTGRPREAIAHLEKSIDRLPDSALLNLALLLQKVHIRQATQADFQETGKRLLVQPTDAQAVMAMRRVVDEVMEKGAPPLYANATLEVLNSMGANRNYARFPEFRRLIPYLKGRLYLAKLDGQDACREFRVASSLYGDVGSTLMMAAELASYRVYRCGLVLLNEAEGFLEREPDKSLKRSRGAYEKDIRELRNAILTDSAEWENGSAAREAAQ
jgi:tetratricopeptide (TPR) repeat protein